MGIEVKSVVIAELGAQGDGIARQDNGTSIFVPGALPGETVKIRVAGDSAELCQIETVSPERSEPVCQHFERCGGCRTQHFSSRLNAQWKESIVRDAFRHRALDIEVEPIRTVPLHARRRAVLAAKNDKGVITLGYREAASHTIVDLSKCPVLDDRIVTALPHLKTLAKLLLAPGEATRIHVLATTEGLDVATSSTSTPPDATTSQAIAEVADRSGLVRLSIGSEPAFQRSVTTVQLAGLPVEVDARTFLQATVEAESILTSLVLENLGRAKRVADLFAGVGTFSFAIARMARVLAIDSDRKAIAALDKAARGASGLKPLETLVRDLMTEPLSRIELEGYDAVIFDPPRAGAKAQAAAIGKSSVPRVIAISCNPATLARDTRILVDAGFLIERVIPIDQFLYSPHIEAMVVLGRKPKSRTPRRRLI